MAGVVFQRIAKVYGDGTRAVDDLTLTVRDGEFVVFVGPSGSGKTTPLRMVAGLEEISEGTISIGDRAVNHLPARDRDTSALGASSDSSAVLVGPFGPGSAFREGEPVDAVVDTGHLHFLDPDTGRGFCAIDKEGAIT